MITLGCDIGSLLSKAVILDGERLVASKIVETHGEYAETARPLIEAVLQLAAIERSDLAGSAATGRGAEAVEGVDFVEEQLICVGEAVAEFLPRVEMAIEIGGQSITALLLDAEGGVVDLLHNDKCASGSGRFLEVMSGAMGIPVTELDERAARSLDPARLSSQCGVFMESEVVSHLNAGVAPADIAFGLCDSVASIVVTQARRLGVPKAPFTLTGGVARIQTVVALVRKRLNGTYHAFPLDPQLSAAVGAALLAGS